MAETPRPAPRSTAHPRRRVDRSVLWSGVLWLLSFPLLLVYLAVVGMVAGVFGIRLGDPTDADRELALNVLYMALVLGTYLWGALAGLRGWRRRRLRLALACCLLNVVTGVVFALAPVVL